jgi:hypothetical protein
MIIFCSSIFTELSTAASEPKKIVACSEDANVTLYATERAGMYEQFEVKFATGSKWFPFWRSVTSPIYSPRILTDDVNQDGKKEVIIVLVRDHGTALLDSDVHVFQKVRTKFGEDYHETLVDVPKAVVLKNSKFQFTPHKLEIMIGDQKTVIDLEELDVDPENAVSDLTVGDTVSYDIVHHKLQACVGAHFPPAKFFGEFVITYELKDGMYQAEKVEFAKP